MTPQDAHQFLLQFDCLTPDRAQAADRAQIRTALAQVTQQSDYQILGICADTLDDAKHALQTYATALGYNPPIDSLQPVEGPVYLKFNPRSGLCYADSYTGDHRGVLVSCQSAYEDGLNQMYGHLPLDVFASA